jgi:hypothetical protein
MNMNTLQLPTMAMTKNAVTKVNLVVHEMIESYRLTKDDLSTVFGRYGQVVNITINGEQGAGAIIEFSDYDPAVQACQALNGKVLSEGKGTLMLSVIEEDALTSITRSSTPTVCDPHDYQTAPPSHMLPAGVFDYNIPVSPVAPMMHMAPPGLHQEDYFIPPMPQMLSPLPHIQQPEYPSFNTMSGFQAFQGVDPNMHFANQMHYGYESYPQQHFMAPPLPDTPPVHFQPPLPTYQPPPPPPSSNGNESGAPANGRMCKFTCRFDVGIENEMTFQVARRIIGVKGGNMKRIVRDTGIKLRLRGRGSGFLEGATTESE